MNKLKYSDITNEEPAGWLSCEEGRGGSRKRVCVKGKGKSVQEEEEDEGKEYMRSALVGSEHRGRASNKTHENLDGGLLRFFSL